MESTTAEQTSLEREIAIAASPETEWQFLVDPEKSLRWWGLTASFDPRPGGEYRIQVIPGHTAGGEFVEVDPPRRLVYTWGWEEGEDGPNAVPPGSSTVEIELVPTGDGTTLRFLHRDLPSVKSVESHGHGWDHYLERLAIAAPGGDPGPDPWLTGEM
ncbi:MAG: SRPBCC domain-containing protein [Actinomycetota bacterium]|nr:SRPBCC domain-containing protein [Actinomycetota bacterium]